MPRISIPKARDQEDRSFSGRSTRESSVSSLVSFLSAFQIRIPLPWTLTILFATPRNVPIRVSFLSSCLSPSLSRAQTHVHTLTLSLPLFHSLPHFPSSVSPLCLFISYSQHRSPNEILRLSIPSLSFLSHAAFQATAVARILHSSVH